ncbi:tetratricopeptide repeat protein [Desulfocicer vacuolatum]|nr:tetratricopeptide repeat protein [Desulfocicer vacuolatum]
MKASINAGYYNGDSFYRPVAMLSFALNWYIGKSNVWGYHFINTVIHIISALFLYLATLQLFKTNILKGKYWNDQFSIAIFSTLLWAIHPIQSQGVTYIVQRMASMAAMFYIIALYCYLKARLTYSTKNRLLFYSFFLLGGILAVGCKENAALFPLSVILMEIIFFHKLNKISLQKKMFFILGGSLSILFIMGAAFLFYKNPFGFLSGYAHRPFTLWERLLTECRIFILYFKQIFYPVASNYSIVHDIKISKSLFSPWTTLSSLIAVGSILIVGVLNIKKRPLLSFAILFYFLNHLVESTILPLELIFEHRNYLPSMFLFLPVSAGLHTLIDFYENKNRILLSLIVIIAACFLFLTGFATYIRNFDWQTEETLWKAAIQTAPGNPRCYQNLASLYYQRNGMYDISIALNEKALTLDDKKPEYSKMVSYDNLQFNYMQKKEFEKAVFYGQKAVEAYPDSNKTRYNYIVSLLSTNQLKAAEEQLNILIYDKKRLDIVYLYMKAHLLLKMGRYLEAKSYILKSFKLSPLNARSRMYLGFHHFYLHDFDKTNHYLRLAIADIQPDDQLFLHFVLIENAFNAGRFDMAHLYLRRILSHFTLSVIFNKIKELEKEQFPIINFSFDRLKNSIIFMIDETATKIAG